MFSRFIRFALVGGVATGIQYVILIALVHGRDMSPAVASTIGYVASAGVNYFLNYRFTFRSNRSHGPALLKFALLASVGLLINAGLMKLLVGLGWYYVLAQVCATGVVLLWNFFGNSVWTFGTRAAA